jgi:oligopeptide/dipeptide ABC transporter ATP-binding protein
MRTPSTLEGPAPDGDAADPTLLEVRGLSVAFPSGDRQIHAVDGVDFTVGRDEILAVIGESGSGKSVTSRAVMHLLPGHARVSGSVRLLGRELVGLPESELRKHRGRDVAMVFQDPARSLNPTMKIGVQITEAMRTHLPLGRKEAQERAVELLRRVRLPSPAVRYHEYPHQLSGGMRQRVMIAIALACRPKLLIADEATTALDVTTQAQIMDLLLEFQAEYSMALVLISHDMGLAATYAQKVMVMYAGRVVERAATRELFADVRMPYTRVLLDAIPRLDREPHSRFPVVSTRPPDLTRTGSGCAFAPRCPAVQDDCTRQDPVLEPHDNDHHWACHHPHASARQAPRPQPEQGVSS